MPKTAKGASAAEVSGLHLVQLYYQQILAATLAVSTPLTPTTAGEKAVEAMVQCTGGTVRFRCDTTAPTASVGNILRDGDTFMLRGAAAIVAFRAIVSTGAPILDISYWG